MALTSTITANAYQPFAEKHDDFTPPMCEILQTAGNSGATTTAAIIATATVSDEFLLTAIQLSFVAPTAGAIPKLYLDTQLIAWFPSCAADTTQFFSLNFGEPGMMGGTTTTYTVSLVSSATITCYYACLGKRKK